MSSMTTWLSDRCRMPLIAGNWKMHKTSREGAEFAALVARELKDVADREVVVAPAFTALADVVRAVAGTAVQVAAQDVHWEREGPYTGEVSALMLRELGVGWVIVGHSERRSLFFESDEAVSRKVRATLDEGLRPIMCVGETEPEREAGLTHAVLGRQVRCGLAGVNAAEAEAIAIAYEPVWAIGTGRSATPEIAQEAISHIRGVVRDSLSAEAAKATRILYGGSVRPDNIDVLMSQPDIDGVLVGGASLDVAAFTRIVRYACCPYHLA